MFIRRFSKGAPSSLFFPAGVSLVFFCFAACAIDTDLITIRTEGRAPGVGLSARNAAIADAHREAVMTVLHSLAPGIDKGPLEPILRNAGGYVPNYELLRHDHQDGATRVELDAHILEKPLRQDLAAIMLPRFPVMPRVLLAVNEHITDGSASGKVSAGSIVEPVLLDALKKQRLDAFDRAHPELPIPARQLADLPAFALEDCGRMAQAAAVDVLIAGQASAAPESAPSEQDTIRNRATITLRFFRGADGKMTDDLGASASVYSLDPHEGGAQALQDAAAKLTAETVVAVVIAALGARQDDAILLTVNNPGAQERFDALVAALSEIPEVKGVQSLFYSEHIGRIRLRHEGAMSGLIRAITGQAYAGEELRVRKAVMREIELEFPARQ